MSKPKIGIVIGSTREGRFGEKAAKWIYDIAVKRNDLEFELIDLRDFPLPFFNEPVSPAWGPSKSEVAQAWQKKVASLDGFIFTAAEYNRGPTAVLKNALDYAYNEWTNKPVGFVGYGGLGGARAIEQLRLNAIELQMAPIRSAVHIVWADFAPLLQGQKTFADMPYLDQGANDVLDQIAWWSKALNAARHQTALEKAAAAE